MTYLYEYLIFLAEAVTIVVALLIIISAIASLGARQHGDGQQGHLQVTKVNDRLRGLRYAMEDTLLPAGAVKKQHKQEAKADAQAEKALASELKEKKKKDKAGTASSAAVETTSTASGSAADETGADADVPAADPVGADVVDAEKDGAGRVYVIRFDGDVKASRIDHLRLEVSAILTIANSTDEVVICLESPGGMVHSYG